MAKLVGARVQNSGNISIANATPTALTFDTELFDTDSIHSLVLNTSRLTCQTAGKYVIIGTAQFALNATGRRYIYIKLNGTVYIAQHGGSDAEATAYVTHCSCIYDLSLTDYVELFVYQDRGGALNVEFSGEASPVFQMHRIG